MTIVTFYSYKGGVGRSMALANVALKLAKGGHKVLAVDWDLEAPGLEEYFNDSKFETSGRGLLDLLIEKEDYRDYLWHIRLLEDETSMTLLPSGRDEEDYYSKLERFNQNEFFEKGGGDFLETLRNQWLEDFDFVLIDSRTGLSDTSGICTIFMPDIVVGLFTATLQSVRGTRDVLQLAQNGRQRLSYDRSQFSVIPVPCRMGSSSRYERERWLSIFDETVGMFFDDWRPVWVSSEDLLRQLSIPHASVLSFGSQLLDPSMGRQNRQVDLAFDRLTSLIKSDLSDLTLFNWKRNATPRIPDQNGIAKTDWGQQKLTLPPKRRPIKLFLSFSRGGSEAKWIEQMFLPTLRKVLRNDFNREVDVFADFSEISAGVSFANEIRYQISRSDIMLIFNSERYIRSSSSADLASLLMDEKVANNSHKLLYILTENTDSLAISESEYNNIYFDFREFYGTHTSLNKYTRSNEGEIFTYHIRMLAEKICHVVENQKQM